MSRELIPIKRILASGKRCRERGADYPIVRWFIDLCIHYERLESDLASALSQWEAERVGLLGEIAGLKSQGPFTVQDDMVFCEDTGVYFNPAFPQGVADKLNALQALVKRHEAALEKLFTMNANLGKNAPSEYVVVFDKPSPDKQWRVFADSLLAAIEAAMKQEPPHV